MSRADDAKMLAVAHELAVNAADEIQKRLHDKHDVKHKADQSLVTEADLLSDTLIRTGIAMHFPDHGILSEETGLLPPKQSAFTWCIDPLDGTKAFAKAIPGYCVMVGLLRDGEPYLGVVADPSEGHVYAAVRGGGAKHYFKGQSKMIQVSRRQDPRTMPLVISTGFPADELERIRKIVPGPVLDPINSVGIKIGLLVRQQGDVYINHHGVHYWDTCAPQLILEEAGGRFTRWDGAPLTYEPCEDFSHHSKTIASNGTRHEEIVDLLNRAGGKGISD